MTIEEAARALQDSTDRSAQLQAAGALRDWAGQDKASVLGVLEHAIRHPDYKVRSRVVLLLGELREGYDLLVAHPNQDPSAHVRTLCAGMLCYPNYPPAVEAFITALGDADQKVVFAMCRLLGHSGANEAVGPLRQVLEHRSWLVRFRACEALYHLNAVDQRVLTVLEALARDPEAERYNRRVLGLRQRHPSTREPTVDELLDLARQALDGQWCDQAASAQHNLTSRKLG